MLAAALLVIVQVASVADVASPRPAGWVTDQAGVVSADDEARLDAIADELHRTKGVELAVVTVDSVPGTPKQFATELFNHWKIGSAATNNGVLVLLVMSQRRLEVETGDGIEGALPAQWLADMQTTTMVPRFKQKQLGGGLVAGVQAIAEHVKREAPVGGLPPVVVGDFNAEPEAAEIRFMTGLQTLARPGGTPRSAYFADAFAWAGQPATDGLGPTFDRTKNPYAAYAREPPRRIDYVFVRGPDDHGRGEPLSARVVCTEVEEGVAPSDHYGVLAEISVSR